jgi:hypothetical protein
MDYMEGMEACHSRDMKAMEAHLMVKVAQLGESIHHCLNMMLTEIMGNLELPPAPQSNEFTNKIILHGAVQEDVCNVKANIQEEDFHMFGTSTENLH